MTDDFDRDLARRLRAYESRVPEPTSAPSTTLAPGRGGWGLAALAAAAVLVIAVLAGNLMNQRQVGADGSPSPTPSLTAASPRDGAASPSTSPTGGSTPAAGTASPAPTEAPQAAITGVAWQEGVASSGRGFVTRITAEGGRFYALGALDGEGAIWSSSDGASWQRADLPRPSAWANRPEGSAMASELATVNGRLLAIGSVQINDYSEVVAWESSDGATWTEVDTGDFRTDGDLAVDLTTGPGGLVAITHQYVSGSGSAWRSADGGRTWTEHRPPGTDVAVLAAVGTTRGYLLAGAVNETDENPPTSSPRIWYSPDGQGTSWQEATLEGSADAGLVEQLTIDGSGRWVAIGMLNQRTTVWRSTDRGLSWQVTADLGAVDSSRTEFRLAGAPDGFIAISGTDPAVTWTSPDGAAWSDGGSAPTGVADDASIAWARGIARIGDLIVVVGLPTPPSGPQGPWFSWIGQLTR